MNKTSLRNQSGEGQEQRQQQQCLQPLPPCYVGSPSHAGVHCGTRQGLIYLRACAYMIQMRERERKTIRRDDTTKSTTVHCLMLAAYWCLLILREERNANINHREIKLQQGVRTCGHSAPRTAAIANLAGSERLGNFSDASMDRFTLYVCNQARSGHDG